MQPTLVAPQAPLAPNADPLTLLAVKYGTDKASHAYTPLYRFVTGQP